MPWWWQPEPVWYIVMLVAGIGVITYIASAIAEKF